MKERTIKIPLKNYITLIAVFVIGLFSYSYVIRICKINQIVSTSILNNLISTISINDLADFIIENPNALIYTPSYKNNNDAFEKKLFDCILKNHLEQKVFYLNVGNITNNQFNKKIYDEYADTEIKERIRELPDISNILYFKNGLIYNALYYEEKSFNSLETEEFIKTRGEELLND